MPLCVLITVETISPSLASAVIPTRNMDIYKVVIIQPIALTCCMARTACEAINAASSLRLDGIDNGARPIGLKGRSRNVASISGEGSALRPRSTRPAADIVDRDDRAAGYGWRDYIMVGLPADLPDSIQ